MGDDNVELQGIWGELLNVSDVIKAQPLAISEEAARLMFEKVSVAAIDGFVDIEQKPKFTTMCGDRESRFDEIIDIINDAMMKGYTPLEMCVHEDERIPRWCMNERIGMPELVPNEEIEITIRFGK